MRGFLARTLISALGLWLASLLVPGVEIATTGTVLMAALLLGVMNALVRPILLLLTLPITVLTLGLFLLVVNAAVLALVASMLSGFTLHGFWSAVFGAVVVSITSGIASWYVGPRGSVEVIVMDARLH